MADSQSTLSSTAEVLARVLGADAVDVEVDGRRFSLAISVDQSEHKRRREADAGAVTSTGMLHGLWLLPSGGTVPATDVPPVKRARFRSEPIWVREGPGGFERLYSPAGVVTAAAACRTREREAVRAAAALPAIFERYAIVSSLGRTTVADARDAGVGVIIAGRHPRRIAEPEYLVTGRPAVYRWWIAEIAYARWLQANAHPVS